jgi:hypothetical protein
MVPAIAISGSDLLAALGSLAVASIVILLSVLVVEAEITAVTGAVTWGLGLIFFALATDSRTSISLLQFFTGAALSILAWLQFSVSAELTVVTGVLLAAWAAVSLFRQLR